MRGERGSLGRIRGGGWEEQTRIEQRGKVFMFVKGN